MVPLKLMVTRQESISALDSESNKSLLAKLKVLPQVQNSLPAPLTVWRAGDSTKDPRQGLFASGLDDLR